MVNCMLHVFHTIKQNPGSVYSLWPLLPTCPVRRLTWTMGEADRPYVSAPLTHLPHRHVSNLRWNQPPDKQRAAPIPGIFQAAVHLHPAPSVPFQPVLSKQGLDFLGTQVVYQGPTASS